MIGFLNSYYVFLLPAIWVLGNCFIFLIKLKNCVSMSILMVGGLFVLIWEA